MDMEEHGVRCLSIGQFKAEPLMESDLLSAACDPVHGPFTVVAVGFLTTTTTMTSVMCCVPLPGV